MVEVLIVAMNRYASCLNMCFQKRTFFHSPKPQSLSSHPRDILPTPRNTAEFTPSHSEVEEEVVHRLGHRVNSVHQAGHLLLNDAGRRTKGPPKLGPGNPILYQTGGTSLRIFQGKSESILTPKTSRMSPTGEAFLVLQGHRCHF